MSKIHRKQPEIDWLRSRGFTLFGMTNSHVLHNSFVFLRNYFGTSTMGVFKSAVVFELGIFPFVSVPLLYICRNITKENCEIKELLSNLSSKFGLLYASNVIHWLPITGFCFRYCTPKQLIIVQGLAGIGANTILSFLKENPMT
eukprot:UN03728